ncbi:AAA family ATPase [Sulfitobacter sp. W002]|uniref:AAA family ATPase n=1 Tax=Sulfitobacter sp. W002 TaxID=2867024 RepID=UPI0021A70227|nr:AAA family ATPase [Sulfitobacter sp. W002]UWR30962.1 AAA family ATPase [Sulfitobacter sp. W002]
MDFLNSACLNIDKITRDIKPQEYIDGHLIPMGVPTLFGVAGGSGKTTSILKAAIGASATGKFEMFGARQHDRPLRVVLIFGEEAGDGLGRKIRYELKNMEEATTGQRSGNLKIVSWEEFNDTRENPEPLFSSEDGTLTDSGRSLWKDLIEYKPDFVAMDTLSSLSRADYNSSNVAYATMSELRKLARNSGAAVVMTAHLNKGGQDKVSPKSAPGEMLSLLKGSGSLIDAARHAIVMLFASQNAYTNLNAAEKDAPMMAAVKTNVPGCELSGSIFPVLRSHEHRNFVAIDGTGKPLIKVQKEANTAIRGVLHNNLPNYIKLAAQIRRPFAISQKSATSVETLSRAALAEFFPDNIEDGLISNVLEGLEAENIIVRCTTGRTGTGGVWDVPEGDYANQHEHEKRMREIKGNKNYKLPFNAGAPSVEDFKNGLIDDGKTVKKQKSADADLHAILSKPAETPEVAKDEQDIEVPF